MRRFVLIAVPFLWLLALFLIPFGIVLKISLSDVALARPPYVPQFSWDEGIRAFLSQLDFENFAFIGAGAIVVTVVAIALLAAVAFPVYGLVFRRFFGGGLKALSIRSLIAAVVSVVAGILAVVIVFAVISFFFPSVVSLLEVDDYLYFQAYLSSLKIAAISTALTLLVGYPMAYGMARSPNSWRPTLMMLVILPFWTSFLIRVYAWRGILSQEGYLNQVLLWLGVIGEPLTILNTNTAVYIGVVYTYLPFMILPIYAALEKLDVSLIEAAEDLGCSRSSAFWLVTIPLSRPGIVAGCFLVFIPTLGEFVIPSLLGGSGTLMIGKVLWEEFFNNRDWPVASAVAIILLLILIVPIVLFQRNQQRQAEAGG